MHCNYACGKRDHLMARRQFLGAVASGSMAAGGVMLGGLSTFTRPATAADLARQQKRVIVFNMHGGLSQLESWDPKPGAPTGGPFRAIPTSVPGTHICELLPETAKQMHHLAIIRGVDTAEDDHGKGAYMMLTGRRQTPANDFPRIGAVTAKALAPESSGLPGHIQITAGGGGRTNDSAYLGPKYAGVILGGGQPPLNSSRPDSVDAAADEQRNTLRRAANERFLQRRRTALTDAYTYSYEQAQQLMAQRDIFDATKESEADQARYGKHDFGRHCLLARRLLENGITFVQVSHSNYDTHNENFIFHIEQLGEFDKPFATFVADLADRGMLESTLIVVLSEFGRTPHINHLSGRDHWSKAWSVLMGGSRVTPGAVIGKTNDNGTEVIDGKVDHANLFHTYLQAVGVDTSKSFDIDGRPVPIADPASHGIPGLLA
ncbi:MULTISPECIES: DUF1501 domain-containing protein [unclassified Schlesneria]|uniref:DUF1501 domain-containing protein n=1 Tax=Schlesneria TaxID=656899 RepID=UPI002EDBEF3A